MTSLFTQTQNIYPMEYERVKQSFEIFKVCEIQHGLTRIISTLFQFRAAECFSAGILFTRISLGRP